MKKTGGSKSILSPTIIDGGLALDDRGSVSFVNEFDFSGVKRFYLAENFSTGTVRAWHGHKKEAKYILVPSGSAIIAVVRLNSFTKPNKRNPVSRFILSAKKPTILFVPSGYANGFRALENNTKIIFFSTTTLEESKGDDYRFPYDYWGKKVWEVENR